MTRSLLTKPGRLKNGLAGVRNKLIIRLSGLNEERPNE